MISGVASFHFISFLPILRQPRTASIRLVKPYSRAPRRFALQAWLTKATSNGPTARPKLPNIGRMKTGCGVGMLALGSPICDQAMTPPLMTISGLAPKNAGFQRTRSASLPDFDRTDEVAHAVGDRGIDRVFGDVAFDAEIVVAAGFAGQAAALLFHFVGGLPGARDDFADAAHRLAVAAHHADRAEVVQNVFRGDGFAANAAFGKRHIFGQVRIEMMADHEHVEMLIDRVDGVRPGGIGGTGQHIRLAANADDVRRVAAARAFGVIGVNRAAFERGDRAFDKSRIRSSVSV